MDNNSQLNKIIALLELHTKILEKTQETIKRIEEINKDTNRQSTPSVLDKVFDKTTFASIAISLDKIYELLKSRNKHGD